MAARIPVAPEMISWAVERAGRRPEDVPHVAGCLSLNASPTWRQLETFANAVHVPVGYLFLSEPPIERLPVPDFRTLGGKAARPSLDLLETVGICQERQAWYREYAKQAGPPQVTIIGAGAPEMPAAAAVQLLRDELHLPTSPFCVTREEALKDLREACEAGGVLVMASGRRR